MAGMDKDVRVRIVVEARPHEEDVTFSREEWDDMTPSQRVEALDAAMETAISNAGGAGYQFLTDDEHDLQPDRGSI